MEKLVQMLGMKNISEMLLAPREELEKCKMKDHDVTDHTINQIYAKTCVKAGIEPRNAFEELMREMNGI
jgi:hypothetical protein